jgi:CheY-like chemotaxis protein
MPVRALASKREVEMNQFVALVVEDDALQRDVLAELLKDEGLEVVECATAEAAELVISTAGPELLALVTDVNLEGAMTGVELAEFAKNKFPLLTVVVLSGKPVPKLPESTLFLAKPYQPKELLAAILN